MNLTNTPYDDVFRTLLNDCSQLIIPVINEVFREHYTGQEKIIFFPNEHFLNQQEGNERERITDTCFEILGSEAKKYHWECQSSTDNSMLVRFFEYDTQIALDQGEIIDSVLTVTFPHSAVLFLRGNSNDPCTMKTRMVTPGGSVEYDIHIMQLQRYGLEDIFKNHLLFLIPFYIFSHESRFQEYEENESRLAMLKQEYETIRNKLGELLEQGMINEYTKCTIIDMSNKVLEHIAVNYDSVKKGVQSVMGGKVLEYEAKTIKNEGRKEGRKEGRLQILFDLVHDGLLSVTDAASKAKLPEDVFKEEMRMYRR